MVAASTLIDIPKMDIMNIHSQQDYQLALDLVKNLISKGVDALTVEEKTQLNSTLEAIEAYKLETESLPRAAAIP